MRLVSRRWSAGRAATDRLKDHARTAVKAFAAACGTALAMAFKLIESAERPEELAHAPVAEAA